MIEIQLIWFSHIYAWALSDAGQIWIRKKIDTDGITKHKAVELKPVQAVQSRASNHTHIFVYPIHRQQLFQRMPHRRKFIYIVHIFLIFAHTPVRLTIAIWWIHNAAVGDSSQFTAWKCSPREAPTLLVYHLDICYGMRWISYGIVEIGSQRAPYVKLSVLLTVVVPASSHKRTPLTVAAFKHTPFDNWFHDWTTDSTQPTTYVRIPHWRSWDPSAGPQSFCSNAHLQCPV